MNVQVNRRLNGLGSYSDTSSLNTSGVRKFFSSLLKKVVNKAISDSKKANRFNHNSSSNFGKSIDQVSAASTRHNQSNEFTPFFAQHEWRFVDGYHTLIDRFLEKITQPKINKKLNKLQLEMVDLLNKQQKASAQVFARAAMVKTEAGAAQQLAQLRLEIEGTKQHIEELSAHILALTPEAISTHQTNIKHQKQGIDALVLLKDQLSKELSSQNTSKKNKAQLNKLLHQINAVREEFALAKNKVFVRSSFMTAQNAQGALFEIHASVLDAQKKLADPNASAKEREQAQTLLRKSPEKELAIIRLQQDAEQAGYLAVQKQLGKINSALPTLGIQHAIALDALILFAGLPLPESHSAIARLHELQIAREEMIYRLARAKVKHEEIIQIQYRARAAGYLVAYKATKKMRDQAFDLAHQIRRETKTDIAQTALLELSQIKNMSVDAQLDILGVELDGIAKQYKGLSAEMALKAHTVYEKNHALAILLDKATSGTTVSKASAVGATGGVDIKLAHMKQVSMSATANVGLASNEIYNIDYDTEVNYIRSYVATAGLSFTAKFFSLMSAKVGGTNSVGFVTDFFEGGRDNQSLEAVRRFGTLANNRHNWIIRGPLRTSATIQKIYAKVRALKNKINAKIGRMSKDPHMPFLATEKVFAEARRRTQSRLVDQQLAQSRDRSYLLEQTYSNQDTAPLSLPAAVSNTYTPTASRKTGVTTSITGKVSLHVGTSGLVPTIGSNMAEKYLAGMAIPEADAQVQGSVTLTKSAMTVQRLLPTSIGASSLATGDVDQSEALIKQVIEKVWDKKSNGKDSMPKDLQNAKQIFEQGTDAARSAQNLSKYLDKATMGLESLNIRLSMLEQFSADLTGLAKYAKKSPVIKAVYRKELARFNQYQLWQDRFDDKQSTKKGISYAIGRAWANTDSAGAMINQGVTTLLRQQSSTDVNVVAALNTFDKAYAAYLERLQNFNAPYTQDNLLRFTEIHANTYSVKRDRGETLDLSVGVANDNAAAPAPLLGVDGQKTHWQISDRLLHANDLREGRFTTKTSTIDISNLDKVLLSLFSRAVPSTSGMINAPASRLKEVRPSSPAIPGNFFAKTAMQLLGLGSNTLTTNYSELYREGIPQAVLLTASAVSQIDIASPNVLSAVGVATAAHSGVSVSPVLKFNMSDSETQTNAVLIMMRDLCFNILQASGLADAGLQKSVLLKIKEALNDNAIQKLIEYQHSFFDYVRQDPKKVATYFLGDAIDGVLNGFVAMDRTRLTTRSKDGSLVLENGFELFSEDVSVEYAKMQRAANWSPIARNQARAELERAQQQLSQAKDETEKQLLSRIVEVAQNKIQTMALAQIAQSQANKSLGDKEYILRQMGVSQAQVNKLLTTKLSALPASSPGMAARFQGLDIEIKEFLKNATHLEKMDFYQHNPIGAQLFAAYALIVNQGNEVRAMYMNAKGYDRIVSTFSQIPTTANGKSSLITRIKNRNISAESHAAKNKRLLAEIK